MAAAAALLALLQVQIGAIAVQGEKRLPATAIVQACGLRVGQTATREQIEAAVARLLETGLFASINYKYAPARGGWALALSVEEEPATLEASLDIAGFDEPRFWETLARANALLAPRLPDTPQAAEYYRRELEAAVKQKLESELETDLATGRMLLNFRPAERPKIAEVRFEGVRSVPEGTLRGAVERVAAGQDYTAKLFRKMLDANARPLFEERGLLAAEWAGVKLVPRQDAAVDVAVTVAEGAVWTLGNVEVQGAQLQPAGFPQGKTANWKLVEAAVDGLLTELKKSGYILAAAITQRAFRPDGKTVDVAVRMQPGRRFEFGALDVRGLDAVTARRVKALWKLASGDPMNEPYVREFLKAAMDALGGSRKGVNSEMRVREGADVVDVTVSFR